MAVIAANASRFNYLSLCAVAGMSDQEVAPETLTFFRDGTYIVFGSASETFNGVFHGLALIPECSIHQFQNKLIEIEQYIF